MEYVEERQFVLHLDLRCAFPDDYDGEEDGYAWAEQFAPIAQQIARAALEVIARHPGWRVRPSNRGRPTEEEVSRIVERLMIKQTAGR